MSRPLLSKCRRIVVKIGTSVLTGRAPGIATRRFASISEQAAALIAEGRQVIIVSSGAVGLGVLRLGLLRRPEAIPQKQAAAAVGQIDLCRRYERAFARRGLAVGQLLLTRGGISDRERFLNARHTLAELLRLGVVPIINENDSVATEELRFGDNDELSALVTNLAGADLLVLLTDIDGLYTADPSLADAQRISWVPKVTDAVLAHTGGSRSGVGTGGMRSKLLAARTAARSGALTVIANGRRRDVLRRLMRGEDIGTLVAPDDATLSSRKHWIAFSQHPRGALRVDAGAAKAVVEAGRSLLAIGIVAVEGDFRVGDLVRCIDPDDREIARGLSAYGATEVAAIRGKRSAQITSVLGYTNGDEIIHRDDLVLV
jgi:glutamate 5-kinase